MTERCDDCKKIKSTCHYLVGGICICDDCYKDREQKRIIEKSHQLKHPSDFKEWKSSDMSELFWIHLGKYIKNPNEESIRYMTMAWHWACHDNHGLANSFDHALKWAGINLLEERRKYKKD